MKNTIYILLSLLFTLQSCGEKSTNKLPASVKLSKTELMNKVKGGWAGQTLGCSYGGVTEYQYMGGIIYDHTPIRWHDGIVKEYFTEDPYLFDDIYMDLTFVDVFQKHGLDAPVDSFANAFANASYKLWHGNQGARYAILQGVPPSEAGFWKNNPHSDDLDFMIESDFAGIMSPGMVNTSSDICDKIGHMIGYGDGWYGGVFVAAMYALAYVNNDIEFIVSEALKTIPQESKFYKTIADVIKFHKEFPGDWQRTWFEIDRRWNNDIGCPDGSFQAFTIDASFNAAYIVIGLLYGQGDFHKTIDISTRCGQDSDCNPANAGGIIGTLIGYDNIPDIYKKEMPAIENLSFHFLDVSHAKAYQWSFEQALELIKRNGGAVEGEEVTIAVQTPSTVRFEQGFPNMVAVEKMKVNKRVQEIDSILINGTGVAIIGQVKGPKEYTAEVECYADGVLIRTMKLPCDDFKRSANEVFWHYDFPRGNHTLTFKWINMQSDAEIRFGNAVIYDSEQRPSPFAHLQ